MRDIRNTPCLISFPNICRTDDKMSSTITVNTASHTYLFLQKPNSVFTLSNYFLYTGLQLLPIKSIYRHFHLHFHRVQESLILVCAPSDVFDRIKIYGTTTLWIGLREFFSSFPWNTSLFMSCMQTLIPFTRTRSPSSQVTAMIRFSKNQEPAEVF